MNKPEKKEYISLENLEGRHNIDGYNQACDDWEKYHKQEVEKYKKLYFDLADCIAEKSYSPGHLKFLVRKLRKKTESLPSVDEMGFIIFKTFHNYSDEQARENWTGKHIQDPIKALASLSAKEIVKRIGKEPK